MLLFVVLHGLFQGLPGIIQAALDRTLGNLLSLGNVLDAHLMVIVHQHCRPLFLGKCVQQSKNRGTEVLLVHPLTGDKLLPLLFQSVKDRVAILVFLNQNFLFLLKITGTLVVSHLTHPRDKGRRFFQILQRIDDFHKGFLGNVASQILVLQGL